MTKFEALEGSVKKWEGICSDETPAGIAVDNCSLCDYCDDDYPFEDDDCAFCPLVKIGEGCESKTSTWRIISRKIGGLKALKDTRTLSEYDNPELTALCHKMRDLLIRLRDEEKELKCVQKTK